VCDGAGPALAGALLLLTPIFHGGALPVLALPVNLATWPDRSPPVGGFGAWQRGRVTPSNTREAQKAPTQTVQKNPEKTKKRITDASKHLQTPTKGRNGIFRLQVSAKLLTSKIFSIKTDKIA
jgi:hypothetical protein